MEEITFIDIEVNPKEKKITDIGAVRGNSCFHENFIDHLVDFIGGDTYIGGHNILRHDMVYLSPLLSARNVSAFKVIDTLPLSPLLFPQKPYHRLLKDDKLQTDSINNPLNDAKKSQELFVDEVEAFNRLDNEMKQIYFSLLKDTKEFCAFFDYIDYHPQTKDDIAADVLLRFKGSVCEHAPLESFVKESPIALAYSLALIDCHDRYSITPPWVLHAYPEVDRLMTLLCERPCIEGCEYCNSTLDIKKALKTFFGYDSYRSYEGMNLQEDAVRAAVAGNSVLAIFPTGGGKSITFQVPALMSGEAVKGLTVVISPLQSLMKDQVDNLRRQGIVEAVTVNGLLDPIERAEAFKSVENGTASLLYLSPESLRSRSIERLLLGRKIARFVIDEAHCFSAWGQDFRVDYMYIGEFIRRIQKWKNIHEQIPVSCFTATAKQEVMEDICKYFKTRLNIDFKIYRASSKRENLRYKVICRKDDREKYDCLRTIIESHNCPTIVYVVRTHVATELAAHLQRDGYEARAYHGKMDAKEKTENQNAFIDGEVQIIVATKAFGMGVDKKDVGLVVHYQISDSLENYVQEAGRAGRDKELEADCFVLFNEEDLNKHFILLNQTKIQLKEIQQVWQAIKKLTHFRSTISQSALEIARSAGWDDGMANVETRVTTAIAALEEAGYVERGNNVPQIFANSILAKTAQEAIGKIEKSPLFASDLQRQQATRIVKSLIASKNRVSSEGDLAEGRVDYIADRLGIKREDVIESITRMREERILADDKDLAAYVKHKSHLNHALEIVKLFINLDLFLVSSLYVDQRTFNLKELKEDADRQLHKNVNLSNIKKLINFWIEKNWIARNYIGNSRDHIEVTIKENDKDKFTERLERMHSLALYIVNKLFKKAETLSQNDKEETLVSFSVVELKNSYVAARRNSGEIFSDTITTTDVENALFYLSRIEAIQIDGGFMVVYNRITINRLEKNNKINYKQEDYRKLEQFYENRVRQIHIVGEYAMKMVEEYQSALQFVDDYFQLNNDSFMHKYFPNRKGELSLRMTSEKYKQLFGELSATQLNIVKDQASQYIVVLAGPGSGKTRVLVHKLASLLLMEDVKHEQLLMLTFSRAAASEFRQRLHRLIGNAAYFVEMKTFHSYCFDLLGKQGTLEHTDTVIDEAVNGINSGEVEISKITKTVLVIDEAQDMTASEYALVSALIDKNETMRVIAVGDDDQNIYTFRGSSSLNMTKLLEIPNAKSYEMTENYRSCSQITDFSEAFAQRLTGRMKKMPISAHDMNLSGEVTVTQYKSPNMLMPMIDRLCSSPLSGTTAVLTLTNEDAMLASYLLKHKGFNATMVGGNDGFRLSSLREFRWFNALLNLPPHATLIDNEQWLSAKKSFHECLASSTMCGLCEAIIATFESIYSEKKFVSDWNMFLWESKMEDFIKSDSANIFVSTIHKAKGKEWDNVFMLLNDSPRHYDERLHEIYVAITRPRHILSIHTNTSYQSILPIELSSFSEDTTPYPIPLHLSFQLTMKDVWLSTMDNPYSQEILSKLQCGSPLVATASGCITTTGVDLLKYSANFKQKLQDWLSRGYSISHAELSFVVLWRGNNESSQEIMVALPQIVLSKQLSHIPTTNLSIS